ncbi:hypothetical protein GCM10010245_14190 [Streptomyces spectabilis]|nr:hypothetical protein GCM10010245_14190 [Streptomyces spectabilis]
MPLRTLGTRHRAQRAHFDVRRQHMGQDRQLCLVGERGIDSGRMVTLDSAHLAYVLPYVRGEYIRVQACTGWKVPQRHDGRLRRRTQLPVRLTSVRLRRQDGNVQRSGHDGSP